MAVSAFFDRCHRIVCVDMTRACAVPQLRYRVIHLGRRFPFGVGIGLKVVGMAARAIRCVSGAWIRYRLRIALMAVRAAEWPGVRPWIAR